METPDAPTGPRPVCVLVAHGTRDPRGPGALAALADALAAAGGVDVRLAFVDVIGPTVGDVLAGVDGPAVVVPAFLAEGYHVRVDLPRQMAAAERDDVVVAPALGPDPGLVDALADRLAEAGRRPGDAVVLAAAGSSDARALADVEVARRLLADRVDGAVTTGYVTSAEPAVPDAVDAARRTDGGRVALAAWLLAPGMFLQRLVAAGADVVTEPLGAHPAVVAALLDRYTAGRAG
ncbi:MAG: sirohydrochlorin chelatase [Streptosporangiales bacterium]|nr:sirohydrochlorin chelatase [Streptosporangiales bacterium]